MRLVLGVTNVVDLVALDKLERDPAVSSPVFVSWITDVVGFLSFLGLASLILL